jgi:hypothetical protein
MRKIHVFKKKTILNEKFRQFDKFFIKLTKFHHEKLIQ